MSKYFILGCSCGKRIQISTDEDRTEIRCPQCHRYVRVPKLADIGDNNSQNRLIGRILENRYRIDAHLADGAMGRVYRAMDLVLNIPVAIKVLKPYLIPEHQEKRFLKEAKIASELVHPGIIMVRNLHRTRKGIHFMVMDFCPGQSLRTILELQPRLPISQAIEIGKQILSALEIAHDKGVIHRDIKPANIMIEETTEGLHVRVLDFGIAKVFSDSGGFVCESLTRTGFIIGTTRYMAPEQVAKGKLGRETDIYAVAALMYHLITGNPPFNEGNRDKILRDIVRKNPTSIQKIFKEKKLGQISKFLDIAILKALSKEPTQRFRYAKDFITALEIAKQPSYWQHPKAIQILLQTYWGRCQRQIRIALLVFLGFIAIILPLSYSMYQRHKNTLYLEQAEKLIQNQEFAQAYYWLCKVTTQTADLQEKKLQVIMQTLSKQIEKQDYIQAIQTLERWKSESQDEYSYELLKSLLQEEILSLQLQKAFEEKNWEQAKILLQKPISEYLQLLQPRSEMQSWLQIHTEH